MTPAKQNNIPSQQQQKKEVLGVSGRERRDQLSQTSNLGTDIVEAGKLH